MNYKSIRDLSFDILSGIHKIPHDVELIVGVPRSGLLVASMIALLLNVQITDIDGLLTDRIIDSGNTKTNYLHGDIQHVAECKKILVVEDTVLTGKSILSVKKRIQESGIPCEVIYFAAYVLPGKESMVDVFLQTVSGPRVFEWNIFHSGVLENSCVDIDGVLCIDPTEEENDDGDKYRLFLKNAAPRIIPTRRIKCIVSSRLEKYRQDTEEWLDRNHVSYERLYLLDSTAEDRRKNGLHAPFKSQVFKESNCGLFIESAPSQALYIHNSTGKPVYCVGNNMLYDGSSNDYSSGVVSRSKKRSIRSTLAKSKTLKKLYKLLKYHSKIE